MQEDASDVAVEGIKVGIVVGTFDDIRDGNGSVSLFVGSTEGNKVSRPTTGKGDKELVGPSDGKEYW